MSQVSREMERLLEGFLAWEAVMHACLTALGYWVDAVDPCSGTALRGPCAQRWSEVHGARALLNYATLDRTACPLVVHPRFGALWPHIPHIYTQNCRPFRLGVLYTRRPHTYTKTSSTTALAHCPLTSHTHKHTDTHISTREEKRTKTERQTCTCIYRDTRVCRTRNTHIHPQTST
jgi:hypothetical protein